MEQLPFLTQKDFDLACNELFTRGQAIGLDIRQCQDYLMIKRQLDLGGETNGTCFLAEDSKEAEYEDNDDKATLDHISLHLQVATVEYTILLSSTYRVPVLYFNIYNLPPGGPNGVDVVYRHLVPERFSSQLSSIGVNGAISMANHPVTGIPCFFIHPCNTAEAMTEIIANPKTSGLEYLQLWLGLVGPCVGLYLPKELALRLL